jgi:hypothetical protein
VIRARWDPDQLSRSPACSCSVPVRADRSFTCSGFGMEWTREARDMPGYPGPPDVRLTQCMVKPWPTLPTHGRARHALGVHPSGEIDAVVLPAARSVTALTRPASEDPPQPGPRDGEGESALNVAAISRPVSSVALLGGEGMSRRLVMTKQGSFKRAVRQHARRTGQGYTEARADS